MIVDSAARASPSQRNAILPAARALRVAFNLKSAQFLQKTKRAKRDLLTWRLRAAPIQRERPPKLPEATPMNARRRRRSGRAAGSATEAAWGSPQYAISCDAAAIRFLTPRVHREHSLREPGSPARRWAAAAPAQRMWRRCAASEDAVEMIMAYHGATAHRLRWPR